MKKTLLNREKIQNFLLVIASIIFIMLILLAIDQIIGVYSDKESTEDLIFPSGSEYHYKTPEFEYAAKINSLGFRDREFEINKDDSTFRIITLGDSFTYGWGVNIEDTWPKILERNLRDSYPQVEVLNLGRPGASPHGYADLAEKSIPLLKPDLVIVAILQGDDIAQLQKKNMSAVSFFRLNRLKRLPIAAFHRLYPNIYALMIKRDVSEKPLNQVWKHQAQQILQEMNPHQRERFENLDEEVRQHFINGELNPGLIWISIITPTYHLDTFDTESKFTQDLITKLSKEISRIKNISNSNDAQVMVVSVPSGVYVNKRDFENKRRIGFELNEEMLVSSAPDDAIKHACDGANVDFVSVLSDFRKDSNRSFFPFDGHFNITGHELFANSVIPYVEHEIELVNMNNYKIT